VTPEEGPRFDVEALREMAGAQAFSRGEAYYRNDQVALLRVEPGRVLAHVAGTEDYRVELTGRGEDIDGTCTCPAFDRDGFCKHLVAVALAVNSRGTQGEAEQDDVLVRIRQHLEAKPAGALVDIIVELAERDTALLRKLELAVAAASLDDKTVEKRLRQVIDGAIGRSRDIDYHEMGEWADGVAEALDAVADLVPAGRPELALRLADRILGKLEQALDRIDDSDGYCGALLFRARAIHLAAAGLAPPEPLALARELFARETGGGYGTFDGAVADYANVLGEVGLAEYRRLASEAWQKLPVRAGPAPRGLGVSGEFHALQRILDFFAEREGDVDARVALRSKDLTSPWSYLELAQFCLAQGRHDEALRRAEDGLWMFEDDKLDERLLHFVVGLLAKAGRTADAEMRLWQAFEKAPSPGLFAKLRKLGGLAARDRALQLLETRLAGQKATNWYFPADFLVDVLIGEELFERAWAIIRKHGASLSVKERLARQSEETHPGDALAVYTVCVDHLAAAGGDPAYDQAKLLVARIARLQDAATHAHYVAALKQRYARKRNFIKRLG
jgi:tetratricopeptide (TPR) repeat protein